jgi:hypothetical protein
VRSLSLVGAGASWGRAGPDLMDSPLHHFLKRCDVRPAQSRSPLAAESSRVDAAEPVRIRDSERSRFSDEGMVWRKTIDTSIRLSV